MVSLHDVAKRFELRRGWRDTLRAPLGRGEWVTGLDGVSLEVRRGELFGVLGPNGAGKSTLFRILGTYLTPDRGTITVDGHDVVRTPRAVQRLVGCVLANERVMNWRLSARENLRLYAALQNVATAERRAAVDEVLADVQLQEYADRPVGQLSTGLRQRALIARALLGRPAVLLLDEPTRGLDPMAAQSLRALVREVLVAQRGCTVLLATHDGDEAFNWCDRVAILHRGCVVASDRASVLAERFGDATMGVWTTQPQHAAFALLETQGLAHGVREGERIDGWCCVRVSLPNGPTAAAAVLALLGTHGVPIARFERLDGSLAGLIERVIAGAEAPMRETVPA
ncbi:ABC transporter ATP-binding protein [Gemmatimonas sp.]|jgi:ABC-2 type transport system ATP-binding protein|uniref:ABC transporter ATP-binding protein n=1 Tax=Gemmatimonas sp. TaxID=1962908 RepID=UPI0022C90785|nr:ABC transporter ATP-binding protein [Gemmatimonas sp.]MCZ8204298.1 ABC transporter ATP-binding protein [Gemmatimonas sp.]